MGMAGGGWPLGLGGGAGGRARSGWGVAASSPAPYPRVRVGGSGARTRTAELAVTLGLGEGRAERQGREVGDAAAAGGAAWEEGEEKGCKDATRGRKNVQPGSERDGSRLNAVPRLDVSH